MTNGVMQLDIYRIQLCLHILVSMYPDDDLWPLNRVSGNKKLCLCVHCTC